MRKPIASRIVRIAAGPRTGPGVWHRADENWLPVCRLRNSKSDWSANNVERSDGAPECDYCRNEDRGLSGSMAGRSPRRSRCPRRRWSDMDRQNLGVADEHRGRRGVRGRDAVNGREHDSPSAMVGGARRDAQVRDRSVRAAGRPEADPTEDWIPHPRSDAADWIDREPPRYESVEQEGTSR